MDAHEAAREAEITRRFHHEAEPAVPADEVASERALMQVMASDVDAAIPPDALDAVGQEPAATEGTPVASPRRLMGSSLRDAVIMREILGRALATRAPDDLS